MMHGVLLRIFFVLGNTPFFIFYFTKDGPSYIS